MALNKLLRHQFCLIVWRFKLGRGRGDYHLTDDFYAQCNRCGYVDESSRYNLSDEEWRK